MATRIVTLSIVSGPARETLFDALRLGAEGREVEFTLSGEEPVGETSYPLGKVVKRLEVESIAKNGNDGHSWKLGLKEGKGVEPILSPQFGDRVVAAYYDSNFRKGTLSYEK